MNQPRHFLTLEEVVKCVPVVSRAYSRDAREGAVPPIEEAGVALANLNEALVHRLMLLESIAPKKITVAGQTYVWHCPDHLIPESR